MKITKKQSIKACDDLVVVADSLTDACGDVAVAATTCKYESALELISAAIESLAEVAQDDQIAKDSIANLGVVMLDLKGGCC